MTSIDTPPRPAPHRSPGAPATRTGWRLAPRIGLALAAAAMVTAGILAPAAILLVAIGCLGAVTAIVAVGRYGWRPAVLFYLTSFVISTVFENLSITTGFPLGHYHYPGNGLRIWHFPILVGLIYGLLGMIVWLTTSTLLDGADLRLADRHDHARPINVIAVPALAAALMTMYDLGSDSAISTINGTWVWENGGGVFGVPWTNYLGWWLVCYLIFQPFALLLARRTRPLPVRVGGREPLAIGVIGYFLLGAASLAGFVTAAPGTTTDLGGQAWSLHALHETLFTINLFGTIVIAALAGIKLARNDLAAQPRDIVDNHE